MNNNLPRGSVLYIREKRAKRIKLISFLRKKGGGWRLETKELVIEGYSRTPAIVKENDGCDWGIARGLTGRETRIDVTVSSDLNVVR